MFNFETVCCFCIAACLECRAKQGISSLPLVDSLPWASEVICNFMFMCSLINVVYFCNFGWEVDYVRVWSDKLVQALYNHHWVKKACNMNTSYLVNNGNWIFIRLTLHSPTCTSNKNCWCPAIQNMLAMDHFQWHSVWPGALWTGPAWYPAAHQTSFSCNQPSKLDDKLNYLVIFTPCQAGALTCLPNFDFLWPSMWKSVIKSTLLTFPNPTDMNFHVYPCLKAVCHSHIQSDWAFSLTAVPVPARPPSMNFLHPAGWKILSMSIFQYCLVQPVMHSKVPGQPHPPDMNFPCVLFESY